MNSKQQKTILAIFKSPTNGNLEWAQVESLLKSLGCAVIEGSGSSVTFELNGKRAYFHRPHPQKEALKYRVKAVKAFLISIGVKP
ncbi:MAG: type II toxin-antitoxin system HicA family toxin [Pseudomonadaceae bacterium]|nr:type II toxin-antitoxin system HicA family toxin [Pseudomonadaceae bacterium]